MRPPAILCAGALLMLAGQLSGCTPPNTDTGDDNGSDAVAADAAEVIASPPESVVVADASASDPSALDHVGELNIGDAFSADDWLAEWTSAEAREITGGDCEQYSGGVLPPGMSMMVLDGAIARFELSAHQHAAAASLRRAPFGLRLGQTKAEALALLPEGVEISAHEYEAPQGEYLTWRDPASKLGIRLETYLDIVEAIYWGDAAAATLIEGCA
jgi:hypothetical protein